MALASGTNCGFVTTAPAETTDPNGSGYSIGVGYFNFVSGYTSPADAVKINSLGWWINSATSGWNYKVLLYSDTGGVPGDLLYTADGAISDTTLRWAHVDGLNWTITGSTTYWIGWFVHNESGNLSTDRATSGFNGYDYVLAASPPAPFNGGALEYSAGTMAVYAVYEVAHTGTNTQINIGDSWKEISAAQINIGDTWKPVAGMQVNIGDTWKPVF